VSDDPTARILAAIESVRTEVTTLRADMMARLDRLQDRLTTQREAAVVNFGAAERAERIAKATREDVQTMGEQINALIRQVRTLSGRMDQIEDRSA
jgi:hypothetical protein